MQSTLVGNAFLVGGGVESIPEVLSMLQREGIDVHGNPDVYVRTYARYGADDARELRERASMRSAGEEARVFIVATPTMTSEAQNVLLKTLEEPPAGARFFIIVSAPQTLLPTLRSRMQTLELKGSVHGQDAVDVATFLLASPESRLEMLKPLLEKDEDDKRDLRPILSFLAALEAGLAKEPEGLRTLYRARKYIGDKGALVKPLLEEVALLTPTLSR